MTTMLLLSHALWSGRPQVHRLSWQVLGVLHAGVGAAADPGSRRETRCHRSKVLDCCSGAVLQSDDVHLACIIWHCMELCYRRQHIRFYLQMLCPGRWHQHGAARSVAASTLQRPCRPSTAAIAARRPTLRRTCGCRHTRAARRAGGRWPAATHACCCVTQDPALPVPAWCGH